MNKKNVTIYTDGACSGNPGRGGFGIVLQYKKNDGSVVQKTISQGYLKTTNNRMELRGVLCALESLKKPCKVTLYSDSKYVVNAINQHWLYSWIKKNWKLSTSKPVKNVDLWKKYLELEKIHDITLVWVKGHAQNEFNNLCDELAVNAANSVNLQIDEGFNN